MQLHLIDDDGFTWLLEERITGERALMLLERARALDDGIREAYRRAETGDQTAKALLACAPMQKIATAMGCHAGLAEVILLPSRT